MDAGYLVLFEDFGVAACLSLAAAGSALGTGAGQWEPSAHGKNVFL